jgi:hypothetical protein
MPNGQVPAAPGFDIGALGKMLGGMNLPALANMLGGINMNQLLPMLSGINMNQLIPVMSKMIGGGLLGGVPQAQPGPFPIGNPAPPVANTGLVQQIPGQPAAAGFFPPIPEPYISDPRVVVLNTMKPFLPPDKCRIIDGVLGVLSVIFTINAVLPRRPVAPPPVVAAAPVTPPTPPPPPPPTAVNVQLSQN